MVEGVSGGTIYHPFPFQQKLFAPMPQKNGAAAGQGRNEHWIVWGCLEMTEAELSNLMQHDPIERPRSKTTSSV